MLVPSVRYTKNTGRRYVAKKRKRRKDGGVQSQLTISDDLGELLTVMDASESVDVIDEAQVV